MPRRARQPTLPVDGSNVSVLGMGYVGLPLALAFAKRFPTIGFDIDAARVEELQSGRDRSQAVTDREIYWEQRVTFTADLDDLRGSDVFVVAVPTPIDEHKRPDLTALKAASRMVGEVLQPGGLVIFESTVYPGATEEVCVPLIEEASGLKYNWHFFVGYSPERLNPGDPFHRLTKVVKITSGSTRRTAKFVDALYGEIIEAGTFPVADLRTAEAAKVIENTQRDLNIALVNEFAMIFDRLGIDTDAVLEAAGTKWNFLPFTPGLVGGHCIGVDPYYLTHKAEQAGHHTELILAGRRINDAMAEYVAGRVVRLMERHDIAPAGSRILVLGLTFKENCPDVRNTKVVDLVGALEGHGAEIHVHDPWVHANDVPEGIRVIGKPEPGTYDAIVGAVRHTDFLHFRDGVRSFGRSPCVVFDVKQLWSADVSDERL
ncbi:MAG: nucleotide sugar dehydrogenase [Gammaproteobacteria bacterium]|nr:nucleotide sugar dehydrogenase [Gammaproteobacteria bacterium]MDE0443219.1 nucleotide sugar dehydrogenase [Gammaproteobacteria bacterium]